MVWCGVRVVMINLQHVFVHEKLIIFLLSFAIITRRDVHDVLHRQTEHYFDLTQDKIVPLIDLSITS